MLLCADTQQRAQEQDASLYHDSYRFLKYSMNAVHSVLEENGLEKVLANVSVSSPLCFFHLSISGWSRSIWASTMPPPTSASPMLSGDKFSLCASSWTAYRSALLHFHSQLSAIPVNRGWSVNKRWESAARQLTSDNPHTWCGSQEGGGTVPQQNADWWIERNKWRGAG